VAKEVRNITCYFSTSSLTFIVSESSVGVEDRVGSVPIWKLEETVSNILLKFTDSNGSNDAPARNNSK
jgi:hypothetical protein